MSADTDRLVPRDFASVEAILTDVINRWHEQEESITDWPSTLESIPCGRPEGWAQTAERLQLINTFQWHEEDKSRDHGADDTILAATKRSIDASNRRRVQTIDALDDIIFTGLKEAGLLKDGAQLNSESPASIIDRLTVLALKIYHVDEALAAFRASGEEPGTMQERLDTLTEQSRDLGACLNRILTGIRAGDMGLKLYRQVKVYRQPGTGKLVADLD
jgi:hypothetical protein